MRIQSKSRGISLVEILVAMALGAVLVNAVIQVFVSNSSASRTISGFSSLQENARTGLGDLTNSLRLAGHYGGLDGGNINVLGSVALTGIGGCNQAWIFNTDEPIRGYEGDDDIEDVNGLPADCIPDDQYVADSDIVAVRYGSSFGAAPIDSLVSNRVYLRAAVGSSGIDGGEIFVGADGEDSQVGAGVDSVGTYNYEYKAELYFLRPCSELNGENCDDGLTTLVRYTLEAQTLIAEAIAEGVEQMQIEYGIDEADETGDTSKADYVADVYRSAEDVSDWRRVVSVRLGLVVRTEARDANFTDSESYDMPGDFEYTPDDSVINYQRKLFTKVIQLRNMSRG